MGDPPAPAHRRAEKHARVPDELPAGHLRPTRRHPHRRRQPRAAHGAPAQDACAVAHRYEPFGHPGGVSENGRSAHWFGQR